MSRENILTGRAWVCGDYTDSLMILPQCYWESAEQIANPDPDVLCRYAMKGVDESFAREACSGTYQFIVAGKNFGGGGKSIEHPIIAIKGTKIKAVIAESVSRYFFRNSINNALPILVCEGISRKVSTGDQLEVDLNAGEIHNTATGEKLKTQPLPSIVFEIMEKGGYINYTREKMLGSTS